MATFEFYLDQKVTTWKRTNFEIDAESEEEAKQKAIQFHKDNKTADIVWESIVDVPEETMFPSENDGESTEEIFFSNSVIWNNVD